MADFFRDDFPLENRLELARLLTDISREVQQEKKRKSTKDIERQAKRILKKRPGNTTALGVLMEMEAKRRTTIIYADDAGPFIEVLHDLSASSNRTQVYVDCALQKLVTIWSDGTGRKISKYLNTHAEVNEPGDDFFHWAADILKEWGVWKSPVSLLDRFKKIYF